VAARYARHRRAGRAHRIAALFDWDQGGIA
jgi:hypothetical protein